MKNIVLWKKIIVLIIVVSTLIRVGYVFFNDEIYREYEVVSEIDTTGAEEIECNNIIQEFSTTRDRIDSLELIFKDITDDKKVIIDLSIKDKDRLVYKTCINVSKDNNSKWKKVYLNLPVKVNKKYTIELNAKEYKKIPKVLITKGDNVTVEAIKSYSEKKDIKGQVAIKYGYMSEPSTMDKIVNIIIWIIYVSIIFILLYYYSVIKMYIFKWFEFLKRKREKNIVFVIFDVVCANIIINSSGIEFECPTQIIIYIISIIAGWYTIKTTNYVHDVINSTRKIVLLILVYLYGAFALVGQRILIYPLNITPSIGGIFVFIVTTIWSVSIINFIMYIINYLSCTYIGERKKIKKTWVFSIIVGGLLIIPAIFNLYANNPGISSPDTYNSMVINAHNLRGMYDWHPAFYCMVLKLILNIWDSTYMVICIQYFFWVYVMLEGILYLRRKKLKDEILIMVSLISGLNAANFLHLNTIWKDIPYTLSILWVTIIISKLSIDYEEYKKKWYVYIELIVSLVGICLYRKNGIVPFVMLLVSLVIVFRKNLKIWFALIISVVLVGVIKGPVYSYMDIQSSEDRGMYIGLGQDILGVYYAGGDISEETLKMINVMTFNNNAEYDYTPTWSNQNYELNVKMGTFIKNYINTFIRNPIIMTRTIIAREDTIWNIFLGKEAVLGCVNRVSTVDDTSGCEKWNDYYPARKYNSIHKLMYDFTSYTENTQWLNIIIWRCGIISLLTLIVITYNLLRYGVKRYYIILFPCIGHIMSLLLSTGWSEFRYFWPLNLINIYVIIIFIMGKDYIENV